MPPPKQKPIMPIFWSGTRRCSSSIAERMSAISRSTGARAERADRLRVATEGLGAALCGQEVDGERGVPVGGEARRDRADVIGEPAVLVDHEHRTFRLRRRGIGTLELAVGAGERDRRRGGRRGRERGGGSRRCWSLRSGLVLTASSSPLEHAASNAPAAVVLKPRSARRFSASRRVRRASAKSSATSSARYSRSAMRSRYRTAHSG